MNACATSKGAIPDPPKEADLVSDGSPQARQALRDRYSVKAARGSNVPLAAGGRVVIGRAERPFTQSSGTHPEVRKYLASDPSSAAHLLSQNREKAPQRVMFLTDLLLIPPLLILALYAADTLLVGLPLSAWRGAPTPAELTGVPISTTWSQVLVARLLLLAFVGVPLLSALLATTATCQMLRARSDDARDEAIYEFNRRLVARIDRGARTPGRSQE